LTMPFEIRDDIHIKKLDEPLIFENYEQVLSISNGEKLKKPFGYWDFYLKCKKLFEDLHEQIRLLLLDNQHVPQKLWDEYKEAKADFMTAQEIINRDYEKYAE
jgi:hypothetical protein